MQGAEHAVVSEHLDVGGPVGRVRAKFDAVFAKARTGDQKGSEHSAGNAQIHGHRRIGAPPRYEVRAWRDSQPK
jgi:hypothetical protein